MPATHPSIDVIIPVHTPERPILRAVSSVLRTSGENVRAVVVCHNMAASAIDEKLAEFAGPRLLLVEHHDGIPSPAGPMNAGVRTSQANYLAFLGSDDEYEPGVFPFWSEELADRPDLLIGQVKYETVGRALAPAPRVGRFQQLQTVPDLLVYRTAPIGMLIKRELFHHLDCPGFTEGIPNGEDLALSIFLATAPTSVGYSRALDGYWVWESGGERVTGGPLVAAAVCEPVRVSLSLPWVAKLNARTRASVAMKLAKHNILEPIRATLQLDAADAAASMIAEYRAMLDTLDGFSPGVFQRMSLVDARLVEAVRQDAEYAQLVTLASHKGSLFARAVTANPRYSFSAESMIQRVVRILLVPKTLRAVPFR